MKKFFLLLAFLGLFFAKAQNFEGTITYQISYPTIQDKALLVDKPKTMTLFVKGNKIRFDIDYFKYSDKPKVPPTPVIQKRITDIADKSYFELLSVGKDSKYIIETPSKMIEEKLQKMPPANIALQDSTKMICGYLCRISILTIKYTNPFTGTVEEMPLTIYHTEVLGNKPIYIDEEFKDISGLMLEFTIFAKKQFIPIKFTAIKVKKKKIKDTEFEKPAEGFQVVDDKDRIQFLLNGGKL
jgi:hypothetical protein